MIDYIIVGAGLAGLAFAETALQHGKSILVFDDNSLHSSSVAAGVYNPVILKRFSGISGAQQQLDAMKQYYKAVERRLNADFNHPMPVLRKFSSVEEQNNWFAASDKPALSPFLSTKLVTKPFADIASPFGFGEVLQTGFVDTKAFVCAYRRYLENNGMLVNAAFGYEALEVSGTHVSYGNTDARHIVFSEGFGIRGNPFFNYLPLAGTKGELIVIRSTELSLTDAIIKSDVFIIPLGKGLFKVGATYEWDDKTETPTQAAKSELIEKLEKLIGCAYEIVSHEAGIRPTIKDRKALIGTHPQHKNLHVLNGLGTRGVMLAPKMAQTLFDSIESGEEIAPEINIGRFKPV
jgi:glycine/D-amino acid oxidase-like deaminating enzyme